MRWPMYCLPYLALPMTAALALLAGCASTPKIEPRPGQVRGLLPAEADARAEEVRRDPVAYLQRVGANCRALKQYTLTFTRLERRGLLQLLYGPEHVECWFRREPFSLRMKWLDKDSKYTESGYVSGFEEDKVRFVTRTWTPPLLPPPAVNKVDLQTPVIFGETKRPMTDFGLERMMERTLDSYRKAGDDVVISYEGLVQLDKDGPTLHHLHLEYPSSRYRVPIQELYIDVATDLPAGTILKYASGEIDASYFYADVKAGVKLTAADFLLEPEREAAEKIGKPAAKATR